MNPVGIHFSYWTQEWSSEPIPFVRKAQECGFDILEVNAPKIARMSQAERAALKSAADKAGLGLTYSIGMTADMDLTSEDAATRKMGISFLQDLSRAMKTMDGTIMAGINYSSWPRKLFPSEDKAVLTERAVQAIKEAIKAAEDCDVLFCVEVVNRFEHFIMNTAAEGIAFCKQVDSPNCKLLLDTFHMNIEEDSFRDSILQSKGWLGHFHLGETNRRPPGEGRIPWPEIFRALREIDYQGVVTMEPFLVPGGSVGRDVSLYRDLLGGADRDALVKRSVQFVRSEQKKVHMGEG
jgi:D-psicose/D-tagatose/L-ribulose 3-epimerase